MASDRKAALEAVVEGTRGAVPKNLDAAIADGANEAEITKQLKMSQEHLVNMRRVELGWFGTFLGGESHASIVVAFIVVILGFASAIGLWWVAHYSDKPEFWSNEAHIALGAATSALTYVFGRGARDNSKSPRR